MKKHSEKCERVLNAFRRDPSATLRELGDRSGVQSISGVRYMLIKLTNEGAICWKPQIGRPDRASMRVSSASTNAKKSAAGKQGRGVDALKSKSDPDLQKRIDQVVADAALKDQLRGNGLDVIRDYPRFMTLKVTRVG